MRPEDIPDRLPPHPQEAKLRRAELELANTLEKLARKTTNAIRDVSNPRHRVDAAVLLTQLAQTAAAGQKAMVAAINDQMRQVDG